MSGPRESNPKNAIIKIFNLQDTLDNIPLSKNEIQVISLPSTAKFKLQLLQNYQNLDPVIKQSKYWHKYKPKSFKAGITILENEKLLQYFRKLNNTTKIENMDILDTII